MKKAAAAARAGPKDDPADSSSGRSEGPGGAAGPSSGTRLPTGKETVLLVDNAPMMRGVLARLLRRLGYEVMEASGALEAQTLVANKGEVHLLFMDLSGNEAPDLQLALWFHGMYPDTKILVASVSLWDVNHCIGETHHINFLAKPFTAHELARMVRRVLEH